MQHFTNNFPAEVWTGRNDGPGSEHERWHSVIAPVSDSPGVVLVGFASDEGVRRNNGRTGARKSPDAIRRALASLAIHDDQARYDAGTIIVVGRDLETGHDALSDTVAELAVNHPLVVVLGGGHETAFGSHRGLLRAVETTPTIINLDAHFDLREDERPSSGTPFRQIAALSGREFSYSVLGISRANNTRALFATAEALKVHVTTDTELAELSPTQAAELALERAADHAQVHLSIDLDVLPAGVAPGVSAPAAFGVGLPHIQAITVALAQTGKLRLLDVVELNPDLDIDGRTAKVAARLIHEAVAALPH